MHRTRIGHKPAYPRGQDMQEELAVWIDLVNAYGSVPLNLLKSAMEPTVNQKMFIGFRISEYN